MIIQVLGENHFKVKSDAGGILIEVFVGCNGLTITGDNLSSEQDGTDIVVYRKQEIKNA